MKSAKTVAEDLTKLYGDRPGVVKIQEAGLASSAVLIFFDRNELKTVFPSFYKNVKVIMYDLRQIMILSYRMVEFMQENADLEVPLCRQQYDYFYRSMELCHQLLQK